MKMATLNISLPGPMAAFVRAQCERDYGNLSEYFRVPSVSVWNVQNP